MSEYQLIEVDAGETYRINLDNGQTAENILFDISASHARAQIRARANNWTIRNVGWIGNWDSTQNSWHPIICEVPSSNATGLVENVCFETTTTSDADFGDGPGGPYVFPSHAGHLTFKNVYLQHFQDNGIYASSPGHEGIPGSQGTIEIDTCYAFRCGTSNFRLGGNGSEIKNSVAINGHRGLWVQTDNDCTAINCHFGDNNTDVAVGGAQSSAYGEVTLENCRWESETAHGGQEHTIFGESVGTPQDFVPAGIPTTAEAAASGVVLPPDAEFEVIELGPNESFTRSLSDGETLENKLIDVSASGAYYEIEAIVNGSATIRNIGIRGQVDTSNDRFALGTTDPNGAIDVDNVFLPGQEPHVDRSPGIMVNQNHAGNILIRRATVGHMSDNAIYGSAPGTSGGGGGTVRVKNAYVHDSNISGIRLGTDGSYAENCVSTGNQRNYWGIYNDTEIRNCHLFDAVNNDLVIGSEATVCAIDSYWTTQAGSGTVTCDGASAGTPDSTLGPADVGAPTSAEAAAAGTTPTPPTAVAHVNENFEHGDLDAHYSGNLGDFDIVGGE